MLEIVPKSIWMSSLICAIEAQKAFLEFPERQYCRKKPRGPQMNEFNHISSFQIAPFMDYQQM